MHEGIRPRGRNDSGRTVGKREIVQNGLLGRHCALRDLIVSQLLNASPVPANRSTRSAQNFHATSADRSTGSSINTVPEIRTQDRRPACSYNLQSQQGMVLMLSWDSRGLKRKTHSGTVWNFRIQPFQRQVLFRLGRLLASLPLSVKLCPSNKERSIHVLVPGS